MSKVLQFSRSDGTSTKWPDKLDPTPHGGEVNYMRPIDRDELLSTRWRATIGREVAKLLGYEDFVDYSIDDFPEGYRFFRHYKGPKADPRTDPYLYGSPAGRFRSAPEFIRHAYWLFTDETLNRVNCRCKYCSSGKSQTEISRDLGLPAGGGASRYQNDPNRPKLRPIPRPQKRAVVPLNADRVADLRASRRFRCGELVWTVLYPSIEGENEHEQIEFWPAFIREFNLEVDVTQSTQDEPWAVNQSHTYEVRFLGLGCSDILPESSLLPFQAHGPPPGLIERLRIIGNPKLLQDKENFDKFCPVPLRSANFVNRQQLGFRDAATPFALAIQMAAHLVRYWTPVQEYTFQGEVPSTSSLATQAADGRSVVELKETRCQGLWWGAERIWMDELVRLQPSRAQVFANESNMIYPPSPRADGRGVLMQINSILGLRGETKDSPRVCKVAGTLYELAEENYEEEDKGLRTPPPSQPSTSKTHSSPPIAVISSPPLSSQQSPKVIRPFQAENVTLADPFTSNSKSLKLAHMPPYPLPEPPSGYKFRPIMKPGYELVLDVAFIAGRYYPDLLTHPSLEEVFSDPSTTEDKLDHLRSLVSLIPGAKNSMECTEWTATRGNMFKAADTAAQQDLSNHWRRTSAATVDHEQKQTNPSSTPMNVDPT